MIVPVMAISNLVLTQQIYSEETNGAHAHNRDRVPSSGYICNKIYICMSLNFLCGDEQNCYSEKWQKPTFLKRKSSKVFKTLTEQVDCSSNRRGVGGGGGVTSQ